MREHPRGGLRALSFWIGHRWLQKGLLRPVGFLNLGCIGRAENRATTGLQRVLLSAQRFAGRATRRGGRTAFCLGRQAKFANPQAEPA
jgi:hypothetical protein